MRSTHGGEQGTRGFETRVGGDVHGTRVALDRGVGEIEPLAAGHTHPVAFDRRPEPAHDRGPRYPLERLPLDALVEIQVEGPQVGTSRLDRRPRLVPEDALVLEEPAGDEAVQQVLTLRSYASGAQRGEVKASLELPLRAHEEAVPARVRLDLTARAQAGQAREAHGETDRVRIMVLEPSRDRRQSGVDAFRRQER